MSTPSVDRINVESGVVEVAFTAPDGSEQLIAVPASIARGVSDALVAGHERHIEQLEPGDTSAEELLEEATGAVSLPGGES